MDVRDSLTKETVDAFVRDNNIGIGITQIITDAGIKTDHTKIPVDHFQYPLSKKHTIFTDVDHGLNGIQKS